jgi:IstB-like ATP binding protein
VLFELIATRYERRSLLITANQPFGEWGKIFADQAMTLATIDRLVHHATILEMNVESYRRSRAQFCGCLDYVISGIPPWLNANFTSGPATTKPNLGGPHPLAASGRRRFALTAG